MRERRGNDRRARQEEESGLGKAEGRSPATTTTTELTAQSEFSSCLRTCPAQRAFHHTTHVMHSEARPAKRTKYRACDSCVTSKTRCDEVLPSGCLVCRKRHKQCSLADLVAQDQSRRGTPSVPASIDGESGMDLRHRLEVVEARSWDLEQRVQSIETTPRGSEHDHITPVGTLVTHSSASMQGFTPMQYRYDPGETRPIDVDVSLSDFALRPSFGRFDERIFSPINARGFPCVIQRGLATIDQVDMAFQVFKHRFSHVLPFAPFLISSTPTPTHPFVILAILTHVPSIAGKYIYPLVEESVAHVGAGAVGDEVLLALLILALQPDHPDQPAGWSPLRTIAMAYQVGQSAGLEGLARSAVKHSHRLCEPWWSHTLDRVLLWEAIKAQYNLIHLAHSRSDQLLVSHAGQLPDHPVDNYHEMIVHLRAISQLTTSLQPFVHQIAEAESDITFSSFDLDTLLNLWSPLTSQARDIARQHPRLELAVRSALFSLGTRTTMLVQSAPTPLIPAYRVIGNTWVYEQMLRTAFSLAELLLHTDKHLPKYLLMTLVIATTCCRRVTQYYEAARNGHPPHLDFSVVSRAEHRIKALGGAPAMVLAKVTEAFTEEPGTIRRMLGMSNATEVQSMDTQASVGDENTSPGSHLELDDLANMFNLDYSSWEALLGAFQPPHHGTVPPEGHQGFSV